MFTCKCCIAKNEYIQDLKSQVAFLQSLLTPMNNRTPSNSIEADAVLSGSQTIIELDPITADAQTKQQQEEAEILAERDRILSGNY